MARRSRVLLALAGGVILATVFLCRAVFLGSPSPSTDFRQAWKLYRSSGNRYSLQYPAEISPRLGETPAEVDFVYRGKVQAEQTELTDGYSLSVTLGVLPTGVSLRGLLDQEILKLREIGQLTVGVHPVHMAGKDGLGYSARTLADYTVISLPLDATTTLRLAYGAIDPRHVGYGQTLQRMVESLKIPADGAGDSSSIRE